MYGLYLDCDSQLAHRISEKLYLTATGSDVSFIFHTESGCTETILAHKCILAAGSSVFDLMFYGPLRESDEITIVNASPKSFKEFLQFFYLPEVQLTPQSIAEVMNLCKKYDLFECMEACADSLQSSLAIDDLCWGYSIALDLEQEYLIDFCEQKIKENIADIFESDSFLECDVKILRRILSMASTNCSASEIVGACMKWAKAECARKNLFRSVGNLKATLGDSIDKIPFEKLTLDELSRHCLMYKQFFTGEELRTFAEKILQPNDEQSIVDDCSEGVSTQPSLLSDTQPLSSYTSSCASAYGSDNSLDNLPDESVIFSCDRRIKGKTLPTINLGGDVFTAFSSTEQLLLRTFYVSLHGTVKFNDTISYDINVKHNGITDKLICGQANAQKGSTELRCSLFQPLEIDANKLYIINVYLWDKECIDFDESPEQQMLRDNLQRNGVNIKFRTNNQFGGDSISRLIFVKQHFGKDIFKQTNLMTRGFTIPPKFQMHFRTKRADGNRCIVC